jgi:aminoglycoside phosphotransferase (APT) family kinase protein
VTATITPRQRLAELIDDMGGRVACLALSKDPNAKVTLLLFRAGQDLPSYVAKVPSTDAAVLRVELEATALAQLDRSALGSLAETIPQVAARAEHLGHPVLVTTALPGRLMLADYHTWRHTARPALVQADFDAAGQWLAELQERTSSGQIALSAMLEGTGEQIRHRFGDDPAVAADVAADIEHLSALQDRLADYKVPRVVMHGDFWPGNLLISAGRVRGVIDWEAAEQVGLPTRDLARFMITYSLYLDRHTRPGRPVHRHPGLRADRWGAGLEYAISGAGWYPELARLFVADGLRRLGVPPACGHDILLAEIARIAAEADHPDFARNHLLVYRRVRGTGRS